MAEDIVGVYEGWAEQVRRGFSSGLEASERLGGVPRLVQFCGMGTSGFAGEYAGIILDSLGWDRYWWVTRGLSPRVAGRDVLVVAISYTGRTGETIACARRAKSLGSRLAAVTSGGDLASEADVVAAITPGRLQRASLAEMVAASLGLLSSTIGGVDEAVESIARALEEPAKGKVSEAVDAIASSDIVVVAGCGYLGLAAHRWRTELAENTKMLAKAEAYPESGHNDLVAYQEPVGAKVAFIVLVDRNDGFCTSVMEAVSRIYERHGRVVFVEPEGDSPPARLLRAAQLAGVASSLAAAKRGVDPVETPILHEYRKAARGFLGV